MNRLDAKDGMWLTQKECKEPQRLFLKHIIGIHATYEYWRDATNNEKEQWEQDHPVLAPETTEQL